VDFKFGFIYLL